MWVIIKKTSFPNGSAVHLVSLAEYCEYHVGLHSLAILGTSLIDVLSRLVGSHKADGFDGWMVTDKVHRYTWKKKHKKKRKNSKSCFVFFHLHLSRKAQ